MRNVLWKLSKKCTNFWIYFLEDCQAAFMDKPSNTFEKKPEDFEQIRRWLTKKANDNYLKLHRGIIEGCQRISELIQAKPELIQFSEFVKQENDSPRREVSVKDMLDYLETLCVLPVHEPKDKQRFYKLFVRTLSHEWEAAEPKLQIDNRVNFACGSIMKHARNLILFKAFFIRAHCLIRLFW